MTSPQRPWENNLQNSSQIINSPSNSICRTPMRTAPVLPPRPSGSPSPSYIPQGYGSLNSFGSLGYNSYSLPYRSSPYNSYNYSAGFNNYGLYGLGTTYPNAIASDDAERRFIQYAEESSRNTFANVESIVRAFNSIAMMLDNTFFAMTSSFRAILSVAENFGRLRSTFGQIWYSISIFRLINWLYRKLMNLLGVKVSQSAVSAAWSQAAKGTIPDEGPKGSNWSTLAFLGVLLSAPYIISKFLPKYEDKGDPTNWKSPGVKAKAVFDFIASAPNELTIHVNDELIIAPTYIQEEMRLKNSGWAFVVCNRKSGVVPLNYLVLTKTAMPQNKDISTNGRIKNNNYKSHTKRVSFGENQIFENVDLEDYYTGKKSAIIDMPVNDSSNLGEGSLEKVSKSEVNKGSSPIASVVGESAQNIISQ